MNAEEYIVRISKGNVANALMVDFNRAQSAVSVEFSSTRAKYALINSLIHLGMENGKGEFYAVDGSSFVFTPQGIAKLVASDIGSPALDAYAELLGMTGKHAARVAGGRGRG